jgi:plastocyanin
VINLASKLFVALTGLALIAAIGYGVVVGDRAGADLLAALAGGFAVVALVTALTVADDQPSRLAADAPAPERRNAFTEGDVPSGSAWPLIAAVFVAALALATAAGANWLAAAVFASVIPLGGWLAHVWREHPSFSAPVRQRVAERLIAPIAMPVLGVLGALFIAVMISRVLLAVSTTASWVTALVLASVLVAVLWFVSSRPSLRPSALAGLGVVAVVGMAAAGAIGASAGERQWEPHENETPSATISARNVQFSTAKLEFPAGTDVEVKFHNFDAGTYHNVAFYTSTAADRKPLFNGKPIPDGSVDYKPHTPAPGTYAFICDFHPTMTGELIITPAKATTEHLKAEH